MGAMGPVEVDVGVAVSGVAVGDDHRHGGRQTRGRGVEHLRLDQHDAVDGLQHQMLERLPYGGFGLRPYAHEVHGEVGLARGVGDRGERPGVAVGADVEADDTQGAEPAGHQRAGRRVRAVAEGLHRGQRVPVQSP
ncbi:hypothetical protein Y717_02880 [Streptomyces scopuliridis RB72]|uniref:Uncharacterized protein n=2 Tax=Streptomyces scopuliridis TaxID=452529 RepID=A0A2T7T8S5_9ACTN|nr:hypothetical protein Y717_02880 [Streptomyces scopuliridis RB72]